MDDRERREFLLGLIEGTIDQHDRWAGRTDLPYVTSGLNEAMVDLIEGWAHGSIPGDCRTLQELVAAFGREWHDWQADADRRGTVMIPPGQSTWKAWEAVVGEYRGVTAPQRPPVESVKLLREQRVGDPQICEIYGWIDARGTPETWRIEEELAEPGKHTTGWVDPVTRLREAAATEQSAIFERVKRLRERKVARMSLECPESLEDLVRQNVSLGQIAEMLRTTPEKVLAQCEVLGLPRPPEGPSLNATPGQFEPELPEPMARQFKAQDAERKRLADQEKTGKKAAAETLSVEQQIVQLHEQGVEAADIASELTTSEQRVSPQKVRAVIKRYEEDPGAVAMPAS